MYGSGNCEGKRPVALAPGRPQAGGLLFKGAGQSHISAFPKAPHCPFLVQPGKVSPLIEGSAREREGYERAQGKDPRVLKIERRSRRGWQ